MRIGKGVSNFQGAEWLLVRSKVRRSKTFILKWCDFRCSLQTRVPYWAGDILYNGMCHRHVLIITGIKPLILLAHPSLSTRYLTWISLHEDPTDFHHGLTVKGVLMFVVWTVQGMLPGKCDQTDTEKSGVSMDHLADIQHEGKCTKTPVYPWCAQRAPPQHLHRCAEVLPAVAGSWPPFILM